MIARVSATILRRVVSITGRVLLRLRFMLRNRFSRRAFAYAPHGPIVSLTTYDKRLDIVYLTIESIFDQDEGMAGVYLWLAAEDAAKLPRTLHRLIARGLSVVVVNENLKSYKKLVYCSQIPKWQTVITADDDVFYPHRLHQGYIKHPRAVICLRAQVMSFDEQMKPTPYSTYRLAGADSPKSSWLLPTGVSGVLYPREALDEVLTDASLFMAKCPSADDVWFRFCTWQRGLPAVLAEAHSANFPPTVFPWSDGLYKTNISQQNDIALRNACEYFKLPMRQRMSQEI
jgi:hypothetical protein